MEEIRRDQCASHVKRPAIPALVLEEFVEPVDYGFVPEDGVAGLLDPVVFIGEVEQLAGDAAALEGVEGRKPLGFDDSKVLSAVYDEHRGLPVLDKIEGVLLFVTFGVVPGDADVVPLRKPEFIGVEVGHSLI